MADEQTTLGADAAAPVETGAAVDWRGGLPDDLKDNPALKDFKDVGTLAKSYVDTKTMLGSRIPLPKEGEADYDKKIGEIYAKLGRPDAPDKYGVETPEGFDKKHVDNFLARAHKSNYTKAQAADALDFYKGMIGEQREAAAERTTEALDGLKKEYGDKWDATAARASKAFKHYAGAELADLVLADGTKLGNNASVIKAFAKIATGMGEDNLTLGDSAAVPSLREELNKLTADKAGAYWDTKNPGHQDAVRKALDLREKIAGLSALQA